jgi:hypothetical protein
MKGKNGVRLAEYEDITGAMAVGKTILARSVVDAEVFDLQARKTLLRGISDANMSLWVAEHNNKIVGFFLAIKEQHWFSRDKYASDICFCLEDSHGNYAPSMIRRFIKWAKQDVKVKDITLGISSGLDKDGRTGRMYQNLGFTPVGGIYSLLEKQPCQV